MSCFNHVLEISIFPKIISTHFNRFNPLHAGRVDVCCHETFGIGFDLLRVHDRCLEMAHCFQCGHGSDCWCVPALYVAAGRSDGNRRKSVEQRIGQSRGEFQKNSQRNLNFDLLSPSLPNFFVKCVSSTVFQVSQLQSFSYLCLALTSVAFIYDWPWLARVALMAPVILLFLQARKGWTMQSAQSL